MKIIDLDILPEYFSAIASGEKTFELREIRDRDFQINDILRLHCNDKSIDVEVTSILYGPILGLKNDWCIMSIKIKEMQ